MRRAPGFRLPGRGPRQARFWLAGVAGRGPRQARFWLAGVAGRGPRQARFWLAGVAGRGPRQARFWLAGVAGRAPGKPAFGLLGWQAGAPGKPAFGLLGWQAALEADALAGAQLAAGADQRLPIAAAGGDRAHQHHLHPAAEILVALGIVFADGQRAHAGAMAEEARGKDAGIVEDKAIAGAEVGGEVAEGAIFPAAGGAVHDQHAGGGAVGERLLRDQLRRQVVIEIGEVHSGRAVPPMLTIAAWGKAEAARACPATVCASGPRRRRGRSRRRH